jgi:hypothetical protein
MHSCPQRAPLGLEQMRHSKNDHRIHFVGSVYMGTRFCNQITATVGDSVHLISDGKTGPDLLGSAGN